MKPKISILLPAYKSGKLLQKVFFNSMANWSLSVDQREVIIYDNGGNEEIKKDIVLSNKYIKVIGNGQNIGLNAALNECAKVATGDHFYLCHTDMFLLPGWEIALLEAAKNKAPNTFLFCSRSIEPGFSHIPSQIRKDYGDEWHNFQEETLMKEYKQFVENKIVVNARMPFFMHRKLWDRLGGVDEKYFSYCTDDDLIQDCYDKGVRNFHMIYASLVYHLQGKSNNQQTVDKDRNEPYNYFVKKWQSKYPNISHPGQYHPRLIPFETRIK